MVMTGDIHADNDRCPQYLQDFLLIKDDDKFFSRLLSKENSTKGESSFRFYYRGGSSSSSSIPFHWESEPGTPKHKFEKSTLSNPPLTPPPSYNNNNQSINSHLKSLQKLRPNKPKFYHSIFSKRITSSSSIASLSPSSSRSSSFSMASMPIFTYTSNLSKFQSNLHASIANSPTISTHRCFDSRHENRFKRFRVAYYSMKKVKKLLLSFIGIRASRNIK